MKKVKFKQESTNKSGRFTDWIRPVMTGYHMSCCDCGLVHTINFQAIQIVARLNGAWYRYKTLNKKDYQVEMKIRRNEKLTKLQRKK